MVHNITVPDINKAVYQLSQLVITDGVKRLKKQGMGKEANIYDTHVLLEIARPKRRIILLDHRNNNPFATLYETLWVLSGSRLLKGLKFFLPRAVDYADDYDKSYWRAGYGPRLRYYYGLNDGSHSRFQKAVEQGRSPLDMSTMQAANFRPIDQIGYVLSKLKTNLTTNRAVMSLWDPAKECATGHSKDYPCSNYVHFLIRDEKLDCSLVMRSNDLYWGFSHINVYEFTYIQEIIAKALGVEVGSYYHYCPSLHVYEDMYPKVEKLAENMPKTYDIPTFDVVEGGTGIHFFRNIVQLVDKYAESEPLDLEKMCELEVHYDTEEEIKLYLLLYVIWKKMPKRMFEKFYRSVMERTKFTDMKVACRHFFNRQLKKSKLVEDAYQQVKNQNYE